MTTALNTPKPAVMQDALSDCPNCWETPCACPTGDDGWIKTLRAAFEAKYGPKDSFSWRNPDGSYKVTSLQIAWELWQNAAQWQATRQAGFNIRNESTNAAVEVSTDGAVVVKDIRQAAPSDLHAAVMGLLKNPLGSTLPLRQLYCAGVHAAAELVAGAAPVQSAVTVPSGTQLIEALRNAMASAELPLDEKRAHLIGHFCNEYNKLLAAHQPEQTK